jgi:hypothetical protein
MIAISLATKVWEAMKRASGFDLSSASLRASRVTLEIVPGALISISLCPLRASVEGFPDSRDER